MKTCDICSTPMVPDVLADTFRCPACGFLASQLPVHISQGSRLDEKARETALKPLRVTNYEHLLDECATLLPPGSKLLDVGSAHGWFLVAAGRRGLRCTGIEPDEAIADRARADGHDIIQGFFPQALPAGAKYQVITFNDVFEYIPAIGNIVCFLPDFLEPDGIVIINLPVSNGLIFRLVHLMARFGLRGPLLRMWQAGLPSPHLSYFSSSTLPRLFDKSGFAMVKTGSLESLSTRGLYERIRYDRSVGPAKAAFLYVVVRGVKLIAGSFQSDIQYFVFRKGG